MKCFLSDFLWSGWFFTAIETLRHLASHAFTCQHHPVAETPEPGNTAWWHDCGRAEWTCDKPRSRLRSKGRALFFSMDRSPTMVPCSQLRGLPELPNQTQPVPTPDREQQQPMTSTTHWLARLSSLTALVACSSRAQEHSLNSASLNRLTKALTIGWRLAKSKKMFPECPHS